MGRLLVLRALTTPAQAPEAPPLPALPAVRAAPPRAAPEDSPEAPADPCQAAYAACVAGGQPLARCTEALAQCQGRPTQTTPAGRLPSPARCAAVALECRAKGGSDAACRLLEAVCTGGNAAGAARAAAPVAGPGASAGSLRRDPCEAFLAGCVSASRSTADLVRCQRGFMACGAEAAPDAP